MTGFYVMVERPVESFDDYAPTDVKQVASHGRKGITGELVGSETARVITNCKIPVLVYR